MNKCVFLVIAILCFGCKKDVIQNEDTIRVSVAKWKDGKTSALSFTFDDNNVTNDNVAKLFNKHTLNATFFFISDLMIQHAPKGRYSPNLSLYEKHEIGSHTANHYSLLDLKENQLIYELKDSRDSLMKYTKKRVYTIAYPYGRYNDKIVSLAAAYYPFDRYAFFPTLSLYNGYKKPLFGGERLLVALDQLLDGKNMEFVSATLSKGAWVNVLGHNVGGKSGDYGYLTSISQLDEFLIHFKQDSSIWIDTFSNISLYKEIRDGSKIVLTDSLMSVVMDDKLRAKYSKFGFSHLPITIHVATKVNLTFSGNALEAVIRRNGEYDVTLDLSKGDSVKISHILQQV
jgi:peptidoglycan/xylan/chitin deacetylase (PgdA/CDA1 family)